MPHLARRAALCAAVALFSSVSGAVCDEPVAVMDLFPTLREVATPADRGPAEGEDSLSLAPLLRDPSAHLKRDALFFHYPHYYPTTTPVGAIRSGDWKLLEFFEDDRVELYHLGDDPGEARDLAPSHPERAEALRRRLHAWRHEVGARMPTHNRGPSRPNTPKRKVGEKP